MNAFDELETLSQTLGLINEPQDWGVANSDPDRAAEFMNYIHRHTLTLAQQYAMVELILSSINDSLIEGSFSPELRLAFKEFLSSNVHGLDHQISYWENLKSVDEFPLSKLLKTRQNIEE